MNEPRTEIEPPPVKNVFIIALYGMGVAIVTFIASMIYVIYVKAKGVECSRDPVTGANFIISLVVLSMSAYQFVISALLFVHTRLVVSRQPASISFKQCMSLTYVISVWYTSHLTILPIYWALLIVELVAAIVSRSYILLSFALLFVLVYQEPES